jgi:hypothetical protein
MELLPIHYAQLLGLDTPWKVNDVTLNLDTNQVDIHVDYHSKDGCCPECNACSPLYDCSPQRSWRHPRKVMIATLMHRI